MLSTELLIGMVGISHIALKKFSVIRTIFHELHGKLGKTLNEVISIYEKYLKMVCFNCFFMLFS